MFPQSLPIPEDLFKLLLAVVVGGVIGAERELRHKAAGFRTIIFICVGSTLFTIASVDIGGASDSTTRIAANIVSGIGFLGAGTILRSHGTIVGLTTASTIWVAAALGMGIGGGDYQQVLWGTALVLVVLVLFPFLEALLHWFYQDRTYEIVLPLDTPLHEEMTTIFRESGLRLGDQRRRRSGEEIIYLWSAGGRASRHNALVQRLLHHPDVRGFRY